jgi:hypothetical protein
MLRILVPSAALRRPLRPTLDSMNIVLDCNAYDLLSKAPKLHEQMRAAISAGNLSVIVTNRLWQEVLQSPHREMALSLPVKYVGDSVAFCDGPCDSRIGPGILYRAHLGTSKKHDDALIADAADYDADYLVSEDRRLRKRMKDHALRCKAVSFEEWCTIFLATHATPREVPHAA